MLTAIHDDILLIGTNNGFLPWKATAESVSGLLTGHFGTKTVHIDYNIDRFSPSIPSPPFNLTKTLSPLFCGVCRPCYPENVSALLFPWSSVKSHFASPDDSIYSLFVVEHDVRKYPGPCAASPRFEPASDRRMGTTTWKLSHPSHYWQSQ